MWRSFKFLVLMGVVAPLVGCLETPYEIYATYEEAQRDGAFERGWLPSWLPKDAYQIHETHDLDTNRIGISFSAPKADAYEFPVNCDEAKVSEPASLKTKLFPSDIHLLPEIMRCGHLFVVVIDDVIHAWN